MAVIVIRLRGMFAIDFGLNMAMSMSHGTVNHRSAKAATASHGWSHIAQGNGQGQGETNALFDPGRKHDPHSLSLF
jgi:hypothetical protein